MATTRPFRIGDIRVALTESGIGRSYGIDDDAWADICADVADFLMNLRQTPGAELAMMHPGAQVIPVAADGD